MLWLLDYFYFETGSNLSISSLDALEVIWFLFYCAYVTFYFNVMILTGSTDEAWFDSAVILDSDCDEDFQSVPDGML